MTGVNLHGVRAIYRFEMNRAFRTWMQSLIAPVLTTALYFIVFGSAIGSRAAAVVVVGVWLWLGCALKRGCPDSSSRLVDRVP